MRSKNEPTLTDIITILKSQHSKFGTISSKLIFIENKTNVVMTQLEEYLKSDIANLREKKRKTYNKKIS